MLSLQMTNLPTKKETDAQKAEMREGLAHFDIKVK